MRKLTNSGRIAPVSSREMSSSAPKISSTASSEASTLPIRRASSPSPLPLQQRRDIEPRGVERLQNVVAGGGEEAGLGDIGLFGVGLGAAELGVEPRQLGGALAHAHFQRRVGALQRLGGGDARRDVGDGGDDAAVRHAVGAHLDDEPAVEEALEVRLAVGHVVRKPVAHQRFDLAGTERALLGAAANDFFERRRRRGSTRAEDRGFRRTGGSSRPAADPCRRRRCPGARDRARSAGFRGCSGSRRWRRRAASTPPWSRPCACAAAATAPAATRPRRWRRQADARHSAAVGSPPPPADARLMRRAEAKLSNDERVRSSPR